MRRVLVVRQDDTPYAWQRGEQLPERLAAFDDHVGSKRREPGGEPAEKNHVAVAAHVLEEHGAAFQRLTPPQRPAADVHLPRAPGFAAPVHDLRAAVLADSEEELQIVDALVRLLRIDAAKGRPVLKSVRVVYSDGKERVVRMDRVLGGKRATAIVDLSGSQIDHVVVSTDRQSKGTYTVQGARVSSGVASR